MVFFPTGSNFDQIGFLVLEAKEGSLNAFGNATGGVYSANKQLSQRIRGVLVNPVAGSGWLGVSWDDESPNSGNCKWLGCKLSWHPRVLIVARSDAAFLVDWRSDQHKFPNPFYAWELPSGLNLPNANCLGGSCLVKAEFSEDALPEWLDWKQKRDIVLGFGILGEDLCSLLHEPDEFGGFNLIRLISSGKLELQRYTTLWDLVRTTNHHIDPVLSHANNSHSSLEYERYKFPGRFKYLELDYLSAYLNGDLSKILDLNTRNASKVGPSNAESFSLDCHEALCEKLKISGLNRFRASPIVSLVLMDVNMPTSIREVALRKTWAGLPMELLQLSFSSYSELLDVLLDQKKLSVEFLPVPDLPQLPP
ncbi:unnamed protein product [Linum tenue]|uniref:Uncharacterized protein n=1 Tax=Linum tenue TaxID=586396 RepID=A0AAV0M9I8_9ROSI|nr:unnamed protein product [Linum tenue]